MITQFLPTKFGRPGDVTLILPPARLACSDITSSNTRFGSVSVGVPLPDEEMRTVARAMRESFAKAFPDAEGKPKLPFRRNRDGQWLLFAETAKMPACQDANRKPVDPPSVGDTVQIIGRIAPFRNVERGHQGVHLYLNLLKVMAPAQAVS